ncbi:uncharacterized protein BDR25DRAFT_351951 [Lindgomyces ingoldianus]|uniref:Uncharacterized protein n=1 Tax=Lindgomyces ingoldianus TaxID=673940 RepID=A0ACB6R7W4_9PLEO|nr:uncharacterized protein BDR25DRAFT_351951 [Lindgomyces ingoldianus]KAF2474410.1 hypothetical protein BDR25DRAFT_351951 [Lindgomyces ingoldianus]
MNLRELFLRCGSTWDERIIPLRACLIELFQSWESLGLPGECPYTFRDDEIKRHETEFKQYEEWRRIQEFAREHLDTNAEGWISLEEDFEEKYEQNKALFEILSYEQCGRSQITSWVFPIAPKVSIIIRSVGHAERGLGPSLLSLSHTALTAIFSLPGLQGQPKVLRAHHNTFLTFRHHKQWYYNTYKKRRCFV